MRDVPCGVFDGCSERLLVASLRLRSRHLHEPTHDVLLVQFRKEIRVLHLLLEVPGLLRGQTLGLLLDSSPPGLTRRVNVCCIDPLNLLDVVFAITLVAHIDMHISFNRLDGIIEFHTLRTHLEEVG